MAPGRESRVCRLRRQRCKPSPRPRPRASAPNLASTSRPTRLKRLDAYLEEDVTPYDFATIYNVLPLWNTSPAINGSGQTIAIVGTTDICLGQSASPCDGANDVATYRSAFGLPAGLTPKQVNGNAVPSRRMHQHQLAHTAASAI